MCCFVVISRVQVPVIWFIQGYKYAFLRMIIKDFLRQYHYKMAQLNRKIT